MSVSFQEAEAVEEIVEEVKAVVVEDEPSDMASAQSELDSVGVTTVSFDTLDNAEEVIEAAKDAKIISLDLYVNENPVQSLILAGALVGENPYRGIIIYTKHPGNVRNPPVNFVVGKGDHVRGLYGLISFSILVHDISLSLLREIDVMLRQTARAHVGQDFATFHGEVKQFYSMLPFIISKSENLDSNMARTCQDIKALLRPLLSGRPHSLADYSIPELLSFRQPLFQGVSSAIRRLEQIEDIYIKPTLRSEVRALEAALATHAPQALKPAEVVPEQSDGGKLPVEPKPLPSEPEAESQPALYLSVWFPEFSQQRPLLVVGKQAELRVDIGLPHAAESAVQTDSISNEEAVEAGEIDHVDVIVLCADADVEPLRDTLNLPPKKSNTAKFYITPLKPGDLRLSVVLLLRNDPIHRTNFNVRAEPAKTK